MKSSFALARIWGIIVALFGPVVLAIFFEAHFKGNASLTESSGAQIALLVICLLVISIAKFGEKEPFSSVGFRGFELTDLWWAFVLIVLLEISVPISVWIITALKAPGFAGGLAQVLKFPVWYRMLIVVNGASIEEILYRGYALDRLARIFNSRWVAGLLVVIIFALAHYPIWGPGPVISFLISGGVLTAFYLWKKNLWANILAHVIVDGIGLILLPPA